MDVPTTSRWFCAAVLATAALACACSSAQDTRVHLEVSDDPSFGVDNYQVRLGSATALAAALDEVDVVIPDSMAGKAISLQLWGLADGKQVAYGMTSLTPSLHGTVTAAITLTALSCGAGCDEGTSECSGDGSITCEMQPDGCFGFSAVAECTPAAPFCSNGVCAATCTDECQTGQTECDGTGAVRTCGQFDSDPCLDWSAPTACATGNTCSNGACSGGGSGSNVVPSMPTVRGFVAAVTGPDGLVYAIGGNDGSASVPTVEAYNPSTNTWATKAPMPTARQNLGVVVGADHLIYAIGGFNGSAFVTTVESYDTTTNKWTTRTPLNFARGALGVALGTDGLIYAISGNNGATTTATVEAYNTTTNTWASKASLLTARTVVSAVAGPDGLIYAIGGETAGGYVGTVEAFTPSSNTWAAVTSLTTPRGDLGTAVGDDGMIYAIGGYAAVADLNTVEAYSTTSKTWETRASMPTGRASFGCAAVGSLIYAIGSETIPADVPTGTVNAYNPMTNNW